MLTCRKLLWTGARGGSYREAVEEVWSHRSPAEVGELAYLVHYATLAANSHNTQAWRFSARGKTVTIQPDMSRATPAADHDFHHLYASLGCGAENLAQAASTIGKAAATEFQPEGNGQVLVELASARASEDSLFAAILERQCTRSLFDARRVPADDLMALKAVAGTEGCRVEIIEERPTIEAILELAVAANTLQINDKRFCRELKSWLRFNGRHAAETRDGLYGASAGNPPMPSFLGEIIFDLAFTAAAENDKLARQVRSSSALAVFVSDKDDKAHWVQAGRSYQRFALKATALGLRHAFVNQPVDLPGMRADLSRLLGLGSARPDLMVRLGYGNAMPKSLRRPVAQVMT